jgi:hypothetical protein
LCVYMISIAAIGSPRLSMFTRSVHRGLSMLYATGSRRRR